MSKTIDMKLNGQSVKFVVTNENHERMVNEMTPNKKIAPMHNFLMRAVTPETKENLVPMLENPGNVNEICGAVLEEFVPKLKITLGGVEKIVGGIEGNALSQARVFSLKWFPDREVTEQSMGDALFLEKDFWEKQSIAVGNGVARAFKG